jgi:hypothetical protein
MKVVFRSIWYEENSKMLSGSKNRKKCMAGSKRERQSTESAVFRIIYETPDAF